MTQQEIVRFALEIITTQGITVVQKRALLGLLPLDAKQVDALLGGGKS